MLPHQFMYPKVTPVKSPPLAGLSGQSASGKTGSVPLRGRE
jgi:hypothetical protein